MAFSMDSLTFPMGRLFGVPIRVHLMLPLVAVLAAVSMAGMGVWAIVFAIVVNGPLLLLTVFVHEMGHVTAARWCGFKPDHILLWPLGGLAYISKEGITPKQQIFVSISGPATHLPMMGIWALIMFFTNGGHITLSTAGMWYTTDFVPAMCVAMLVNNLAMLIFNLLVPCIPLDCSQIFLSVLLLCGCEPSTAAGVMVFVSVPVVCLLLAFGVWSFFSGIAMASMTVMMALWLGFQTYRLHQANRLGQLGTMPLFATAMAMKTSGPSTAAAGGGDAGRVVGGGAGGGFKPFDGQGHVLGKGGTNNEVCIASMVAVAINAMLIAQMSGNGP
mmetsp:Transcript_107555/g.272979  ORF Transcript_107555/g.272979 Transcript_107555/m.272979 type:complete len:330 (-) Transcript_107555:398-1387(-)